MATSLICGFEMQSVGECSSYETGAGAVTISTSVVRSGNASIKFIYIGADVAGWAAFQRRSAGGSLVAFAQSARVYTFGGPIFGGATTVFVVGSGTSAGTNLVLLNTTTVRITDGAGGGEVNVTIPTWNPDVWHRWDLVVSGTTRTAYLDGVQIAQSTTGGTASPQTQIQIGRISDSTDVWYFDDLLVDDGVLPAPASGANNKVGLLIPTAGNNANSWTDGAGGTGDIHGSVDNIPPVGVAASTAAAKIKNAASGGNLDYTATMQSYTAGGIPDGSVINAVQAICNDGEEVGTNTKAGNTWIASNPAQGTAPAGSTFDYGDDGGALGTFPTGWTTHFGIVTASPSVTLGTAPTVVVRKTTSSTRVVDVDFMGLYVDYTPPPIAKQVGGLQAVKRANFF